MKSRWNKLMPLRTFDYFFLDEAFNRQYQDEEQFGRLFINFAVLAILISCLGLLGLASYSTLQRTKEVGVRRVLGASIAGIVRLLSIDFLRLILIAFATISYQAIKAAAANPVKSLRTE
jgi:putative ABC transport system permease protein